MHLDTTVSTANPTPIPGINSNDATTFPMALAVIDDVPNPATILNTMILPNWNILFSIPFGTPICKIFCIKYPLK